MKNLMTALLILSTIGFVAALWNMELILAAMAFCLMIGFAALENHYQFAAKGLVDTSEYALEKQRCIDS